MSKPSTLQVNAWSVRAQLIVIVSIVAALLLGVGGWLAVISLREAETKAHRDATFQAGLGATAMADAVAQGMSTVTGLAKDFPVTALLADPNKCQLSFAGLGVFATGHLDIVLPGGRVACSSAAERGAPPGATHAGAAWLADDDLAREPGSTGVFTDRVTASRALAITAPVISGGRVDAYVAVVLPLQGLGRGLDATYGGPQHFAFSVRTAGGQNVVGSDDAGATAAGTRPASIVGEARVPALGWVLSAGQSRDVALGPTRTAFVRLSGLAVTAFGLLLALLLVVNSRIGQPLRRLTAAATQAGRQLTPEPVPARGPAEVRQLAVEFNAMTVARANYETQLVQHALHDPLTGLPNRALALDRIAQALSAAPDPSSVIVLSVDLDRFKAVNASLGYRAGDDLLIAAATRLSELLNASDTLARVGDGFLVCRSGVAGPLDAESFAADVLDRISEPFVVADTPVSLTACVGISRGSHRGTPEELIEDAATAVYAAKEAGVGRHRSIDDELRQRSSGRLKLEADLRQALARGELHVEYQPVVNLVNRAITGAEALLRWTHPTHGPVPPATFIPLAEHAGLIGPIGNFVLEQACRQAAQWSAASHPIRMSVNMSGLQLHAPGFVDSVTRVLHLARLAPAQLCLELTETVLMDDSMHGADVLRDLKAVGVELSIDDFGTGYSSLAYLKRFPVDELKIDRSFIQSLDSTEQDRTLVAAMVAMGHALGLHVLAEGVETEEHRAALLALGCRSAQGYLFSRPQSPARMLALLQSGLPGTGAPRPRTSFSPRA